MATIRVTHFSDMLCVWAHVSQVRIDELQRRFAGRVEMDTRWFHVFGDAASKLDAGWRDRGGPAGYAAHVRGVVERFGHVQLHPRAWAEIAPRSSMPSHLLLCALRVLGDRGEVAPGAAERTAWVLRQAFFDQGLDISRHPVLLDAAAAAGQPVAAIERVLASGDAHAAPAADLELARRQAVQASPTLLFNDGRQRLTGNVGCRIIEANLRELLDAPPPQSSWCRARRRPA